MRTKKMMEFSGSIHDGHTASPVWMPDFTGTTYLLWYSPNSAVNGLQ
ncbi:hypothetical protein K0F38_02890 [Bacteroides fragilis]|nr:hypothetical protein [Bacteroides fragilis]MCE8652339.1 hypothetical protein [Bacteroides fragilis]